MLIQILFITILLSPTLLAFGQKDAQEGISNFYAINLNEGQVAFMWLGEGRGEWAGAASAGVMVSTSEHTILVDPSNILQDETISALEFLDLILISHEHSDHFDPDTTIAIHQKTGAPVIVSAGAHPFLEEKIDEDKLIMILPDDIETIDGITVTAIPAKHPSDRPVIYLINIDGIVVFHGSDSGFVDELNDISSEVHLAFVPAGSPSPTASPDDAASMVRALEPYVTVPVHGLFEQMKALDDLVGTETVMMLPAAFVGKVPTQVVPEFGLVVLILITAFAMTLLVSIRGRWMIERNDS